MPTALYNEPKGAGLPSFWPLNVQPANGVDPAVGGGCGILGAAAVVFY